MKAFALIWNHKTLLAQRLKACLLTAAIGEKLCKQKKQTNAQVRIFTRRYVMWHMMVKIQTKWLFKMKGRGMRNGMNGIAEALAAAARFLSLFLSLFVLSLFSLDVIAQCCDAPVLIETQICQLGSGWISHALHFMNSVSPSNYENPSETACVSVPVEESQRRSKGFVCGCTSIVLGSRKPNSFPGFHPPPACWHLPLNIPVSMAAGGLLTCCRWADQRVTWLHFLWDN